MREVFGNGGLGFLCGLESKIAEVLGMLQLGTISRDH